MNQLTQEEAVLRAQDKLGLPRTTPARVWRTRRLDRHESYYLIELGNPGAAIGVAIVDVVSGEVGQWARLAGVGPHVAVDQELAIELAGGEASASAELVWKPCRATLSPMYPLWEVHKENATVYIDQGGKLWTSLEDARPGSG